MAWLAGMFSGTGNRAMMRWMSRNALAGSDSRASRASSWFSAKRRGTGPAAASPSNVEVARGHSAAATVTAWHRWAPLVNFLTPLSAIRYR